MPVKIKSPPVNVTVKMLNREGIKLYKKWEPASADSQDTPMETTEKQ
ncbi:hypothetical protein IWX76_002803 [Pedobacter sp. CAN_A7]